MAMTEQEAIKDLKSYADSSWGDLNDTFTLAIKALEEVEKLRKENRALKNRCHAITHGTMCFFCPMECSNRKEKYRGSKDEC